MNFIFFADDLSWKHEVASTEICRNLAFMYAVHTGIAAKEDVFLMHFKFQLF